MQIKAAIGSFFVEFSKFEMNVVGLALRALSKDPVFVEQVEKLLGLEARLTLLERMAFARSIPGKLMTELAELLSRTRRLRDQRDDMARALTVLDSGGTRLTSVSKRGCGADFARFAEIGTLLTPSLSQLEAHSTEAIKLQQGLRVLAEKLDYYLSQRQELSA
jgi:hypothetical protein